MVENPDTSQSLTTGARRIVDAAVGLQKELNHQELGVSHWLLVMLQNYGPMLESLAQNFDSAVVMAALRGDLEKGKTGAVLKPDQVIVTEMERAKLRGKLQATERDLAAVILSAAGYLLADTPGGVTSKDISVGGEAQAVNVVSGQPAEKPTPTLDQFGRDLSALAKAGKLLPTIGREEAVQLIIETLCRRTKRNPVLVGPAGVGKTAVVEGLAQRIFAGDVPDVLKNHRIIAIQPSTMVAGAAYSGELEKRMKALIAEASQEGIILFIDEFHSAIGAGGMVGTNDMASILKPALARGELACIAATTDDEYRRFIEPDGALERRFQPIRIQELSPAQTVDVLRCLRDDLGKQRGVSVQDDVLEWLVSFGQNFMRNRHFPDKAVDLLEQCFAYAITQGKKEVQLEDARKVAQRMVGMPLAVGDRLSALESALKDQALLADEDVAALVNRLQVTMRGLDMRTTRANAVMLVTGDALQGLDAISRAISQTMFGADDRIVVIDLARMWNPEDVNQLLGAPPGYIGYSDALPIHRVAQIPWCVLRFDNIDMCHPIVREVVTRALTEGSIRDERGKVTYLSDTVVILTATIAVHETRQLGFNPQAEEAQPIDLYALVAQRLGEELVNQVDLIASVVVENAEARARWIEKYLLRDLTQRYLKQGLKLTWDHSVLEWMTSQELHLTAREWERFIDDYLTPAILKHLPDGGKEQEITLVVKFDGSGIAVNPGQEA
jgi:ATP-dependent Clp protease ATP-binding subunit ClpC